MIGANRSQKLAISSKKIHIFVFCAQERIAPVLLCSVTLFEELREGFTPVALYKRATVSSCHSLQKSDHEGFAQVAHDKREMGAICSFTQANRFSLTINEQYAQKTNERSHNPALVKFLWVLTKTYLPTFGCNFSNSPPPLTLLVLRSIH